MFVPQGQGFLYVVFTAAPAVPRIVPGTKRVHKIYMQCMNVTFASRIDEVHIISNN